MIYTACLSLHVSNILLQPNIQPNSDVGGTKQCHFLRNPVILTEQPSTRLQTERKQSLLCCQSCCQVGKKQTFTGTLCVSLISPKQQFFLVKLTEASYFLLIKYIKYYSTMPTSTNIFVTVFVNSGPSRNRATYSTHILFVY